MATHRVKKHLETWQSKRDSIVNDFETWSNTYSVVVEVFQLEMYDSNIQFWMKRAGKNVVGVRMRASTKKQDQTSANN